MSATPTVVGRRSGGLARGRLRAARAVRDAVARHPVRSVFLVALAARVLVAVATNLVGFGIPDERQYIELAGTVAAGRSAEDWVPGYGQALYDSTFAFTGLLRAIYEVTGPSRLAGQLVAALAGALAACATALLVRGWAGERAAAAAGLVVALMPSQVLWSSVVLRESFVWLAAVAVAVAVAVAGRAERSVVLLGALLTAGASLLVLGHLRDHTMLVLAFAAALAPWLHRPVRARWSQRGAALALALVVPAASGIGIGGHDLVVRAVPNLAVARANLSVGADSAITEPAPTVQPAPPVGSGGAGRAPDTAVPGSSIVEEAGPATQLRYLPTGLVAVSMRPFLWEEGGSTALGLARLETVLWLVLYVLALVGVPEAWRHRSVMAFPVLGLVGILLSSAVAQGNLGTAFRHRSQVLWAVAALAGLGLVTTLRQLERRGAERPGAAPGRGAASPS